MASIVLIVQVVLFVEYIKLLLADIERTIDCLLHEDYSVSISSEKRRTGLYEKTALLIEKYKDKDANRASEHLIFNNIIESLSLGILILHKDRDGVVNVFLLNETFAEFLKIPKYYQWDLLKEKIKPISQLIETENWKKIKHVVSLNINDEAETFFLKTAVTKTNNYEYLIISLETIQQLIDKKEKESWYKLMNVMSHEIINTITPISSLAENLNSLLQDTPDQETLAELSQGLSIIKRRSHHLTSFVEKYRTLAELPLPEKELADISEIIQNTLDLFQSEFKENQVDVVFSPSEKVLLSVDKKQIEQVFINLITNSLYSFSETTRPTITVLLKKQSNRIIVSFSDNGNGIPKNIRGNIFIPYFTTRKDGSGIGLTLTKSILESHDGMIHLKPSEVGCLFHLSFPEPKESERLHDNKP